MENTILKSALEHKSNNFCPRQIPLRKAFFQCVFFIKNIHLHANQWHQLALNSMVTTLTTRNTKSSNKNNNYNKCLLGGNFQLLQEFDFSFVSWRQIIIIVLSVAIGDLLTSYHINSEIPSLTVTQIMLNNCLGPCRKMKLSDSFHWVLWNKTAFPWHSASPIPKRLRIIFNQIHWKDNAFYKDGLGNCICEFKCLEESTQSDFPFNNNWQFLCNGE